MNKYIISNNLNSIINIKSNFKNIDDFYNFDSKIMESNINRMSYPILSLIPLAIILICIDIYYHKCFNSPKNQYYYLYILHCVILVVSITWAILYYSIIKKIGAKFKKIICIIFTNIVMYWCLVMSMILYNNTNQVSAYIIILFVISSLLFMTPITTLIINSISFLIMITFLLTVNKPVYLMHNVINVTFTFIFATFTASAIYMYNMKNYLNKLKLIEINKKLEEIESAKTDFFVNISHELKTPLNIIYTANQMIEITVNKEKHISNNLNKYINMTRQNIYRLNRLICNLIDITKIESSSFKIKFANINIIETIEDIVLSSAEYIESHGISLVFDTDVEELFISCDSDAIERIVLNLLSNATKFTEKGGEIFINISTTEEYVEVSVKDTGIGIPEHMLDNIFNRFIQVDKSTNRKKEGSGIGLALVKSLVELHNGEMKLESKLNEGSKFSFRLPIALIDDDIKEYKINNDNKKVAAEFSDIYIY